MAKQYLDIHRLSAKLGGRSKSAIYRLLQEDPKFPRAVYLGRCRYWDEDAVDAYMEALLKAQTQSAA